MTPIPVDAATSARMARIKQRGTKIEIIVGTELRHLGLRYRKNVKQLDGSPDFANHLRQWAIFVNGCFWHHHSGCKKATIPKSNIDFWEAKFRGNRRRDAAAIRSLRGRGYLVIVIWECEKNQVSAKLGKILKSCRIDC